MSTAHLILISTLDYFCITLWISSAFYWWFVATTKGFDASILLLCGGTHWQPQSGMERCWNNSLNNMAIFTRKGYIAQRTFLMAFSEFLTNTCICWNTCVHPCSTQIMMLVAHIGWQETLMPWWTIDILNTYHRRVVYYVEDIQKYLIWIGLMIRLN